MSANNRRTFLASTAAAAVTGSLLQTGAVHAAGSETLKVGLIGCGGRGTGAARQALAADKNVKLTAMGDAFDDRLQLSLKGLSKISSIAEKLDVPKDRQFTGFHAYQQVIDSGVDVILLATPPQFRPQHLKAAVQAGKHVFAEKPVAVDAPGVRDVLATCAEAKKKSLSIVSGLCLRYSYGFQETIKRIHDGAIGEVHSLQANDYRGGIWVRPRQDDWTDMHWQMRNWYYFTWLSGDFNVEQHVHNLDVCSWIMNGYPTSAMGMGGRLVRTGEEYGNIFDHHSVTYEYDSGAKLYSNTRQMRGCANDISVNAAGATGKAHITERRTGLWIDSNRGKWNYDGEHNDVYQTEHDELFASIRNGQPINNGEYMAHSTLLAIMGRMATYTGQRVTWEQALNSQEKLGPAKHEWGPVEMPEVAVPGKTKVI